MNKDEMTKIEDRVQRVIVERLGVTADKVVPEADIMNDLDADSLDLVEVVMAMEEEFNIEVPDRDAEKLKTVQQITDYVKKAVGK